MLWELLPREIKISGMGCEYALGIEAAQELSGGGIVDICPLAADMLGIYKWAMDGKTEF